MISEECSEMVDFIGRGKLIREYRCPFCHEPVKVLDYAYYIWSCESCRALYAGGMDLRYYDPETREEIRDLRIEHEQVCECDA